jgi:peptidoglycan/xylan/chitin deacetylase (PgdA/CDA1 family)
MVPEMGKGRESNKVHVLITGDVDYSEHHTHDQKLRIFDDILAAATDLNVKLSFYFVAREALRIAPSVRLVADHGHEVGCHGLIHDDGEEYNRLPYDKQREYISEATKILSEIVGKEIRSFRAPRVKVSAQMYHVLEEAGYLTDSSVCSQRMDLISSNMFNKGWLVAPRLPYSPSAQNPYKRGGGNILEVPISALLIPYISSVLYVLGLPFMKLLFELLYRESLRTGKPIVYLYHPYEFVPEIPGKKRYHSNVRIHGFRWRRHLYRGTPQSRLAQHIALWKHMTSYPSVEAVTMSQFYSFYKTKGV